MHTRWKLLFTLPAILALGPLLLSAQHYGFGIAKKTVVLERHLLPDVQLGNVSVGVVFPRGAGGLDANLFASDLETLVAQSGGGIRLVARAPEYEIRCYTTALTPAHIVSKTESAPKFLGKAAQPTTDREAHGNISLDARLVRASDGTVVTAFTESVSLNASNSAGSGAGSFNLHIRGLHNPAQNASAPAADPLADTDTDASLNARMIKTLALRVASHMVLMNEQITVLLAQGGALDTPARLAVNNRWSEYLEQLSGITPPSDPSDNAYLLYNLGVANEALGYAASDAKATLKYLQESSIDYSKAAEAKPSEKYFMEPQKRIETAITRYTKLAESESARSAPPAPEQTPRPRRPAETLTNADIIKLVKAHLDKTLIANKIATAPAADFDLSVDGMVALSQSGVPSDLIAVMQRRMQVQQGGRAQ